MRKTTRHARRFGAGIAATLATAGLAWAQEAPSEETYAYFKTNCTSCHTIGGGPLAGPDLFEVTKRRTREQLTAFIRDPKAAIETGDPYLTALRDAAAGRLVMPQPVGITPERIAKVLDMIETESALPKSKSRFASTGTSDRALTDADRERGRKVFDGTLPLAAGGPSCISCHDAAGTPAFGGGRLGPDLTDVFSRLGGRKPLASWLSSPQSPTMTPVFATKPLNEDEILGVVAWLETRKDEPDAALRAGGATTGTGMFEYLAAGVAGLVALLAVFDFAWRGRFRGVRRSMVEASRP